MYDKASGIWLEVEGETVVGELTSTCSHSIIDTNIFEEAEPTPTEGVPVEYIYIGVIVVVIVIVVIVIALKKRSK